MPMKPPPEHENVEREDAPRDAGDGRSAIDAAMADEESAQRRAEAPDLDSELAAERDRVLRLHAELENLRARTARELLEERRYGSLALARDLLPVVDNVDRAIEAAEQSGEAAGLLEGFRMVRQQLVTALAQHHCVPIDAAGQPFDPSFHEAILQQPSDETPAGHVAMVTQTGYRMHDRVVRPSQVIVSSGPANPS